MAKVIASKSPNTLSDEWCYGLMEGKNLSQPEMLSQSVRLLLVLFVLLAASSLGSSRRVPPSLAVPNELPAGSLFLISDKDYEGWQVDGRPMTRTPRGYLGATSLGDDHVTLSAWRYHTDRRQIEYFDHPVAIRHSPHQTRHQALRIPANLWSTLQSEAATQQREVQRKTFKDVLWNSLEAPGEYCWTRPLPTRVTSKFGKARVLPNGHMYHHSGLDLAAPTGKEVFPAAPGVVAISEDFIVSGGLIAVHHGSHLTTTYAHLSQRDVQVGESINTSDRVGLSGATGRVTGPHLHWEVYWKDRPVDPLQALETLASLCDPG